MDPITTKLKTSKEPKVTRQTMNVIDMRNINKSYYEGQENERHPESISLTAVTSQLLMMKSSVR